MEPPVDVVVVSANPRPGSLGAALASAVVGSARGENARVARHDLYADGFDPRLSAREVNSPVFSDRLSERYAAELLAADAVIVVHPVWFFGPPAVLKGWVERVVREGVAFRVGSGGRVEGLLRAGEALVLTTGNAGSATEERLGDPVTRFWRDVVFGPAGVPVTRRVAFAPVHGSSDAQRDAWLREAAGEARKLVSRAREYGVSHRGGR